MKDNIIFYVNIDVLHVNTGVDLKWISAFPEESEILFPPLTYLQPTGRRQIAEIDGMHFTIVEVQPTIA